MKNLHFQVIIAILFALISQSLVAQESETGKIKELYLSGNLFTFNNFGLQYKSELKSGNFFRIGVNEINFEYSKQNVGSPSAIYPSSSSLYAETFEVGLEKRMQITNRMTAFYGINFVTMTSFQRNKREDPTLPADSRHLVYFSLSPGFGFNSGFIFKITEEFSLSAEVIPRLLFKYSSTERIAGSTKVKDSSTGLSLNLDNQSVRVSLIYKWNKE